MTERVKVAGETGTRQTLLDAAAALLATQPDVPALTTAAIVLSHAGSTAQADEAIRRGIQAHPSDGSLLLLGARLRFEAGDPSGARALLGLTGPTTLSLADRGAAEELLARIEEQAGNADGAVLARARARMLARHGSEHEDARNAHEDR